MVGRRRRPPAGFQRDESGLGKLPDGLPDRGAGYRQLVGEIDLGEPLSGSYYPLDYGLLDLFIDDLAKVDIARRR